MLATIRRRIMRKRTSRHRMKQKWRLKKKKLIYRIYLHNYLYHLFIRLTGSLTKLTRTTETGWRKLLIEKKQYSE